MADFIQRGHRFKQKRARLTYSHRHSIHGERKTYYVDNADRAWADAIATRIGPHAWATRYFDSALVIVRTDGHYDYDNPKGGDHV